MEALAQIPAWLGAAALAAAASVAGFFGKSLWEAWRMRQRKGAERLDALRKLRALLEDSKSVFASQNYMARRLLSSLKQHYPVEAQEGLGFDETFYRLFEKMDEEERELQSLLRSTTRNSMKSLNEGLRNWVREHLEFRAPIKSTKIQEQFAEDLRQLELHLNQWFDKYDAMMEQDVRRSLVYLADEKQQGTGFPKRIKSSIEGVLAELS
jgi:hypothetical protein